MLDNHGAPVTFTVTFTNDTTGQTFSDTFTLQEYLQARLWLNITYDTSATVLVAWLNREEINLQTAYACVRLWREEFRDKAP